MTNDSLLPKGENLRRAIRWLSENRPLTQELIDKAGQRFDLTPLEEEFLLQEFLHGRNSPQNREDTSNQ